MFIVSHNLRFPKQIARKRRESLIQKAELSWSSNFENSKIIRKKKSVL